MRILDSIANYLGYEKKRRVHACGHNHHACVPKQQYLALSAREEEWINKLAYFTEEETPTPDGVVKFINNCLEKPDS